jgi:5-methylcytosine-specific restriction protein A
MCEQMNRINPATVVDHIEPHKGDMVKFWDETNHQGLCTPCHNSKTAREDGGFGHKRKVSI